jgi:hypothetical protein
MLARGACTRQRTMAAWLCLQRAKLMPAFRGHGFVCSARNSCPRSADNARSEGLVHSWLLHRGAIQ